MTPRLLALALLAALACGGPGAPWPPPQPPFSTGTVLQDCHDVCELAPTVWPDARCASGKAMDVMCSNNSCTSDACGLLPCACGGVLPCYKVRLVCE